MSFVHYAKYLRMNYLPFLNTFEYDSKNNLSFKINDKTKVCWPIPTTRTDTKAEIKTTVPVYTR